MTGRVAARRSAGAIPNATAVASVTTSGETSTSASKPTSSSRGSASRPSACRTESDPGERESDQRRRARRAAGSRPGAGARAGRPEPSAARGELVDAPGRADEHEIGDVHAGDQEHESDGEEQQMQRAARGATRSSCSGIATWRSLAAGQRSLIGRLSAPAPPAPVPG